MARKAKKWYVVLVGKDIGVFETWLEASSLISGVPGALHESFNSEEEANRIFAQERDKGKTKVVGSLSQQSNTPSSPTILLRQNKGWVQPEAARSSPRSLESPQFRRSPQSITMRPPSPTSLHGNVTYTRGLASLDSTPSVSPRASRRVLPRAVVRTPPDIPPYPSEPEVMSLSPLNFSEEVYQTESEFRHNSFYSKAVFPKQEQQEYASVYAEATAVYSAFNAGVNYRFSGTFLPETTHSLYSGNFTAESNSISSVRQSPILSDGSHHQVKCQNCGTLVGLDPQQVYQPTEESLAPRLDPRSPWVKTGSLAARRIADTIPRPSPDLRASSQLI